MTSNLRREQLEQEISVLSENIENRKKEIIDITNQITELKRYNTSDEAILKIRKEELSKTKSI